MGFIIFLLFMFVYIEQINFQLKTDYFLIKESLKDKILFINNQCWIGDNKNEIKRDKENGELTPDYTEYVICKKQGISI